jgi:crotonobetainyl-CoA:carnitine CoA-transferase CaiB-like acyl-CoA transferase
VLDFTRILAGPFATMQLADLGADVIKVEAPGRGDETRYWGPPFAQDGVASYYLAVNRNKRSITLDLDDPGAAAIALLLAHDADVVLDNFLPGRMKRFGLDGDAIREQHPGVITATITGFASDSARAGRPGFDLLAQAMGGLMAVTGETVGPPQRVGVAIADLLCGLHLNQGILAALHERDRTGKGRHVEVALLDAQVASLANMSSAWLNTSTPVTRQGNEHPSIAPYGIVDTADGPLALAVGNDHQFGRLAVALGFAELSSDIRFLTNKARVENRDELSKILSPALVTMTRKEALRLLDEAGVPAAPVNEICEVFADPDISTRMVREVDGVLQVASPIKLDGRSLPLTARPPRHGEHTDVVLEALGIDTATRRLLRERGAI